MIWNRILPKFGVDVRGGSGGEEYSCLCFKLLKLGILIVTFLFSFCEISSAQDFPKSVRKSSYHSHSPWVAWSTSESSILPWDQSQMPNIVPLTLKEQSIRESSSNRNKNKSKKQRDDNNTGSKGNINNKNNRNKGKSGSRNNDYNYSEDAKADDLAVLRKQAMDFGSLVVNFFKDEIQSPTGESRGGRGILSDMAHSFKFQRREGEGGGGEDRGVIDWLARLIGVQGKTLGEFLREYQVHVLYDLVFTFFKWIFFLYAGLLIP